MAACARFVLVAAAVCVALPGAARGQGESRLYRVIPGPVGSDRAYYEEGCFDPCMCIAHFADTLSGSFRVTLVAIGDVTDFYEVTDARFASPALSRTFTGSGTMRVAIREGGFLQTLELDLAQPEPLATQRFAGEGRGATMFPGLFPPVTVVLDRNDRYCYDQVLHLVAKPVTADWDGSGAVTVRDVFAYLSDWFAGRGDFDGDGDGDVADLFEFLGDWFARG